MRGSEGRGPLSFAPICNELFLLHPSVTPLCRVPLLSLLPHAEHLCESSDSSVLPLPQPNCPPHPPVPPRCNTVARGCRRTLQLLARSWRPQGTPCSGTPKLTSTLDDDYYQSLARSPPPHPAPTPIFCSSPKSTHFLLGHISMLAFCQALFSLL